MPNSFTNHTDFLISLIKDLADYISYSNGFLFDLLKEVTVNKKAIIDINGIQIKLKATNKNGYNLQVTENKGDKDISFITKGDHLRSIINGVITLDKAIALNKVYVKGNLKDLLGIYRLAIGLLVEGPTDPNLRAIWDRFDENWMRSNTLTYLPSIDEQQIYNYFPFQEVSSVVKNIEIEL